MDLNYSIHTVKQMVALVVVQKSNDNISLCFINKLQHSLICSVSNNYTITMISRKKTLATQCLFFFRQQVKPEEIKRRHVLQRHCPLNNAVPHFNSCFTGDKPIYISVKHHLDFFIDLSVNTFLTIFKIFNLMCCIVSSWFSQHRGIAINNIMKCFLKNKKKTPILRN